MTIDRDELVALLQTFYAQGFDDAGNTPAPLDMTEDAASQITILELLEGERVLIEWEKKEGLFMDTIPDDLKDWVHRNTRMGCDVTYCGMDNLHDILYGNCGNKAVRIRPCFQQQQFNY